jgi:hypothetical protein
MAGMVADLGNWPSRSSCIFHALGVVAEVGPGMATVRDFGRVSGCLLPDVVRGIRLEVDFKPQAQTTKGERLTANSMLGAR